MNWRQDLDAFEASMEPSLTVREIATRLNTSTDTVRRIFAEEPGVLKIGQPRRKVGREYRRRYFVLRIPLSVFLRVRDRLQQK
jgi:hypothetical protein